MSEYKGGRILRIKVKDFMTYDDLEIIPKKGLNIIIGLNGSGKSSLMSAICLGLGGKPQFTGKSTQLSDFIKHGKQKAKIEIELDDPKENVVICRIIEGDKSSWLLNGSSIQQNEVLAKIKKYNIDVGNLCQFLPQEKVADFSKMDKKQRLEVIIQAIGEPSLHTLFNELKKMRVESCNFEKELKKLEDNKASQVKQNDRLKVEVNKQEERKRLECELETLKLQKTIYEWETYRYRNLELKKEKKKLKMDIMKCKKELSEMETEESGVSSSCNEKMVQINRAGEKSAKKSEELSICQNKLIEIHGEIHLAKIHYQTRMEDKRNQKEKLEDLKRQIQALSSMKSKNASNVKDLQERIAQNIAELGKVRETIGGYDSKLEELKLQINGLEYQNKAYISRLSALKNEQNYQMEYLKRQFPDTYQAVCWLEQNKSSFRSTICLPPLLSMKVFRDEDRKFIENMVPVRDLNLFVCTDEDDLRRLTHVLRTQKRLNVNFGLASGNGLSAFQVPALTPELRRMGVERFATDLFTAPEPVERYLRSLCKLHIIPICNETSLHFSEAILKQFNRFYTPNEKFSCSRSRYGSRNTTFRKDFIRGKNIIQSCTNENNAQQMRELEEKINKTQQQIKQLADIVKDLEEQRSVHERSQEQLREKKIKYAELSTQYRNVDFQHRQKLELYNRKKSEVVDEAVERNKVNSIVCAANNTRMSIGEKMKQLSLDLVEIKLQNVKDILYINFLKAKLSKLRSAMSEERHSCEELEKKLQRTELTAAEVKNKLIELKTIIRSRPSLQPEYLDLLENDEGSEVELTANRGSMEDIEQNIIRIEAQLGLHFEENESVLEHYEMLRLSIEEITSRIEIYEDKLHRLKADMEKKKQEWLPAMGRHIKTINKNFSKYYKLLKCAGEISLEAGEDPDDFAEYGLQIRLKYRDNESFSVLSPDHHSGGERNVASIVFILSLQELTTVPFRCVDEINQGMDSSNERKMYEFIAADASKTDSCSQYFLLTPKLLKNLHYHKDVAVHIIFNSRFLDTKLNVKKHLEIVARS